MGTGSHGSFGMLFSSENANIDKKLVSNIDKWQNEASK